MKTIKEILIGCLSASIVMIICYSLIALLNLDVDKYNFFVGWLSCIGCIIGLQIYSKWKQKK